MTVTTHAGPRTGRTVEAVIYVAGFLVLGVVGVAPDAMWTFPALESPAWVLLLVLGGALLAVNAFRNVAEHDAAATDAGATDASTHRGPRWVQHVLTLLIAAGVLWLLRSRTFYGDGRAIVAFIEDGVVFHKREPLSPTLFLIAQRSLGEALGWTPLVTVQVVNTIAGAFGVLALVGLARRIGGTSRTVQRAGATVLLSCGAVQLFAGYAENYTLPTVCMLGASAYGLDALAGRQGLTRAFGLWTLSCMFHLSGIVFGPAMLWLVWTRRHELRRSLPATLRLLAVTILPALVLYGLMMQLGFHRAEERGFGGGDGLMLVPLFEQTGMSQYLMFRPAHLLAIANQQLLVAPLGVVMIGVGTHAALWRGLWRTWSPGVGAALLFLVLVAGGFLGLTLIWNPDLGPLRDWDLFAPVGFYLYVGGVALVVRHLDAFPRRAATLLTFVAIVNLSRTLPFVLHNAGW